jgi:hypothetical protein
MQIRSVIVSLLLASSVAYAEEEKIKKEPPAAPATDASAEVKAGTGVEKHEVIGEAQTFPAGTTVWVWSRVANAEPGIKHVWKRDGKEVWTATLKVGGKSWATQSRRAIPKAGAWEVDVQNADGTSLGTVAFKVE